MNGVAASSLISSRSLGLLCAAVLAAAACGGAESDHRLNGAGGDDSGSSQTASTGATTSTQAGGGDATWSSASGTGGSGDTLAVCLPACAQAADCAIPSVPLYDASHYACNDGLCGWTGCQSNVECQSTFQTPDYACADLPGAGIDSCLPTCAVAADCAIGALELYDADHYTCDAGVCRWLGCESNAECAEANPGKSYACQ